MMLDRSIPIVVPHKKFVDSITRLSMTLDPPSDIRAPNNSFCASVGVLISTNLCLSLVRSSCTRHWTVNLFTFSETRSISPILNGITPNLSIRLPFSSEDSAILSSTLSTATWVDATISTFFPDLHSLSMISIRVLVFPDPGGPSRIAKSFVDSAISTNLLCSSVPGKSLLVRTA